jgi:hypothetical protein
MKYCKVCLTILILLNISFQQAVMAQPIQKHVVPLEKLQNRLISHSAQRMEDIAEVQKLLRHDLVRQQLGKLMELEKVELALATLDDETLERLAGESQKVNDQIEAGMATWGWVAIAAIAAFVIIVIIAAAAID